MIVYRIYVTSHYEEDSDSPSYFVDFNTLEEAEEAFDSYLIECTLSGQRAYTVSFPERLEISENGEVVS